MQSLLFNGMNIFIVLLVINSISALQESLEVRSRPSLFSQIHQVLFDKTQKRLRRTSAISISSTDSGNRVFEYSSVHAADEEDSDLPTAAHTYITSDPTGQYYIFYL